MHISGAKWGVLAVAAMLAACGGNDDSPYPTLKGDKPLVIDALDPEYPGEERVGTLLYEDFLAGAREAGLIGLRGHRVLGGMRASIYNAMPVAGAEALAAYMRDFQQRRG